MKAADRYTKKAAELVVKLICAETVTNELELEVTNFCAQIRRSRWEGRRATIQHLLSNLELLQKNSRRLKLIQGGNDFLARRSRAVLTLIVSNDSKQLNKVG